MPNRPAGCSVSTSAGTPAYVFFNELVTEVACAADALCVCHEDPKPFGEATGWLLYNPTSQSVDTGKGTTNSCNSDAFRYTALDPLESDTSRSSFKAHTPEDCGSRPWSPVLAAQVPAEPAVGAGGAAEPDLRHPALPGRAVGVPPQVESPGCGPGDPMGRSAAGLPS